MLDWPTYQLIGTIVADDSKNDQLTHNVSIRRTTEEAPWPRS